MNTAIEMTPADLAEADRANEIMRDANTAVEGARGMQCRRTAG